MSNYSQKFVKESEIVHNKRYDYSRVKYVDTNTSVEIICPIHGSFFQLPRVHRRGGGCKKCNLSNKDKTISTQDFILKSQNIHGDVYRYDKVDYINSYTPVIITCKEHGDFEQRPDVHARISTGGHGCPTCQESRGERLIRQYLVNRGIVYIPQYTFRDCRGKKRPLPFDFYLPDYNMCIEYDGEQHFKLTKRYKYKVKLQERQATDQIKTDYCRDNNISLVRISFKEQKNIKSILDTYIFI